MIVYIFPDCFHDKKRVSAIFIMIEKHSKILVTMETYLATSLKVRELPSSFRVVRTRSRWSSRRGTPTGPPIRAGRKRQNTMISWFNWYVPSLAYAGYFFSPREVCFDAAPTRIFFFFLPQKVESISHTIFYSFCTQKLQKFNISAMRMSDLP